MSFSLAVGGWRAEGQSISLTRPPLAVILNELLAG